MSEVLKPVPHGLLQAFRAYEGALVANDVDALDRLFAHSPTTLHGDADGLLVGHERISALRAGPGAARRIVQTHVQVIDQDHALVVAVTELLTGGRGQQTQLWARDPVRSQYGGWQLTAAHVSTPAPALDTRVWRIVGDPLVPSTDPDGPLSGETVAVKDLYDVAGHQVGAGNPAWLEQAVPATRHADAVAALVGAGAAIRGISRTDEFAYSLAGSNAHYGTPPNPLAQHRLPGGSSSGSASAVSLGHATIGLGTDTSGSIRVPAAYQGLYGIRTTHGVVSRTGLMPLSPSFDTVGWLTRTPFLLRAVGEVLLPGADEPPARAGGLTASDLVVVPELLGLATPSVAAAVHARVPEGTAEESWSLPDHDAWLAAYQTVQRHEAWHSHGAWLETRLDTLGDDVRERFERGRDTTDAQADRARAVVAEAREALRSRVGDRVVVLPSASSFAPQLTEAGGPSGRAIREATLRLTCLAGLAGLPAVSIPVRTREGLPAGLCLLAAPGRDLALLDLVSALGSEEGFTR